MKKQIIILPAIIVSVLTFNGCKKGEGDPFFSMHSRKARIIGEWNVSSGEGTRSEINVSGTSTTTKTTSWTYDGTNKSEAVTVDAGTGSIPTNSNSKFTMTYEFFKEGKFKTVYTDNNNTIPSITITEGLWNFTDGIGDAKKKSSIVLRSLSVVSSSGMMTTYDGTKAPTVVFEIYQLKNKEVQLQSSYKTVYGASSDTSEEKWTLKQ
jgi:hypothetical protein